MMLQRVTFLTVAAEDFKKAGVTRKRLAFEPAKVTELPNAEAEITPESRRYMHVLTWIMNQVHA